jgi:phage gpG-like protein
MAETTALAGGGRFVWYGSELAEAMRQDMIRRLYLAASIVLAQCKVNIAISARAQGPSKEGEYPHADTGLLRNSLFLEVDEKNLTAMVGTNLIYGLYLEYGTAGGKIIYAAPGKVFSWIGADGERIFSKKITLGPIRGRSYLRRTLNEMWPRVKAVLTGGPAGGMARVA